MVRKDGGKRYFPQLVVRMPLETRRKFRALCVEDGVSAQEVMETCAMMAIETRETYKKLGVNFAEVLKRLLKAWVHANEVDSGRAEAPGVGTGKLVRRNGDRKA